MYKRNFAAGDQSLIVVSTPIVKIGTGAEFAVVRHLPAYARQTRIKTGIAGRPDIVKES